MVRDRNESLDNSADKKFIKQKLMQIKDAKQKGNEARVQRLATELYEYLGWE